MAIVPSDWSVTFNAGNYDIRYIGGDHGASPTYITVLELHRWLQDLADDAMFTGDDQVDITIPTPSVRSTDNIITLINGFNIDATAAEHIYNGSIIQSGGDTIYDGLLVIGASANIQIIQDGSVLADDWWNSNGGLNPDADAGISHRFMLQVRNFGADIDGRRLVATSRNFLFTFGEFAINTGTARGNTVIALTESTDLNNQTAAGTVATWSDIVNDNEGYVGIDADGNGANEFYYGNWELGSRSKNNFYERLKWQTREGSSETLYGLNGGLFRGITHQIPYDTLTGTFDELQDLVWGTEVAYDAELASGLTVGEYYSFATSGAVGQLLALDDNGTSGFAIFAIEPGSGTVVDNDAFTRADGTANDGATVNATINNPSAVGGKGRILADDGSANVWIQILKGQPPVDNLPIWEATTAGVYDNATGDNALANGAPTARSVSTPFVGASTGSAIIGAYGFGIGADDLGTNDRITALDGTTRQPPNNVTFTVNGVISDEDYILVGPRSGGTLNKAQMSVATTALTAANITAVEVDAIPSGTPTSGTIRVVDNNGQDRRLVYTSFTGSTFTIDPTASEAPGGSLANVADFDSVNADIGNNVYVSYIDQEALGALVSAGSFSIGVEYKIETVGTTDFTLIGAASNTVGEIFTATGAGTGTGDARILTTSVSFTAVYTTDVDLFIRVRDGGGAAKGDTPIQTFETSGTLGSAGGSTNAIRTSDE